MNSSEWSLPLRDPQQINFLMLNRFWPLSKKAFTLLFLMDNIKLDGMLTKIKLKIQACFTLYFKFWEGTSVESYKIQLPVVLFLVLDKFLYQLISFLYNFLEINSTLFEKDFCCKIYLFNRFTQTPHILEKHLLCISSKLLLYIHFKRFQLYLRFHYWIL